MLNKIKIFCQKNKKLTIIISFVLLFIFGSIIRISLISLENKIEEHQIWQTIKNSDYNIIDNADFDSMAKDILDINKELYDQNPIISMYGLYSPEYKQYDNIFLIIDKNTGDGFLIEVEIPDNVNLKEKDVAYISGRLGYRTYEDKVIPIIRDAVILVDFNAGD